MQTFPKSGSVRAIFTIARRVAAISSRPFTLPWFYLLKVPYAHSGVKKILVLVKKEQGISGELPDFYATTLVPPIENVHVNQNQLTDYSGELELGKTSNIFCKIA